MKEILRNLIPFGFRKLNNSCRSWELQSFQPLITYDFFNTNIDKSQQTLSLVAYSLYHATLRFLPPDYAVDSKLF